MARRALDADFALHERDELFGNGEAKAGAAVLARGGAVGLGELLEDAGHGLRRNSDARVPHFKARDEVLGVLFQPGHMYQHLALLSELDGVADQVGQNLPQADRVTTQTGGHFRFNPAGQLNVLLVGAFSQHLDAALHGLAQIEIDDFERKFSGFDFREVQDVVDDTQQISGAGADGFDVFPLLLGQPRVGQQAGHAGDGVHRRTDFVAHVGQELRLGAGAFQSGLAGLLAFQFGQLAEGDVFDNALVVEQVAGRIFRRAGAFGDPDD